MEFQFGPGQWAFLKFRALLLNGDYIKYANEKDADRVTEHVVKMESEYPYIIELYETWGCVNYYSVPEFETQTIESRFRAWIRSNEIKLSSFQQEQLRIIHEGESIITEPDCIYVTIPKRFDPQEYLDRFESVLDAGLNAMSIASEKIVPPEFRFKKMQLNGSLIATERRLDAYDWRKLQELKPLNCIRAAVASKRKCWAGFNIQVDKALTGKVRPIKDSHGPQLKIEKNEMRKYANEGEKIVQNIFQEEFPDHK